MTVDRDERTIEVENAGYRLSYLLLSFGLLAIIAYRGISLKQQSWDLFALVVGAGVFNALYQAAGRVLYRRWVWVVGATLLASAVIGLVVRRLS